MENNIFENIYFGKPYLTRDGRKALFIRKNSDKHFPYDILIEGNLGCIMYDETGKYVGEEPHAYDIVSEWDDDEDDEDTSTNGPRLTPWQEDFFNGTEFIGDVYD